MTLMLREIPSLYSEENVFLYRFALDVRNLLRMFLVMTEIQTLNLVLSTA